MYRKIILLLDIKMFFSFKKKLTLLIYTDILSYELKKNNKTIDFRIIYTFWLFSQPVTELT